MSTSKTNSSARWTVLVAGMHHSGTSVIANAIHVLGADLPHRLMPTADSNPAGHFEPEVIVSLNDQVLAEASRSWADWRKLPEGWFGSAELHKLRLELVKAIKDDFGESPLFVLKDPRLCRLLPLWNSILEELGHRTYFVLPYRQPIEVAQSLHKRNGLSLFRGHMLWLRYVLDAEFSTRGQNRVFVRYADLLDNPTAVAGRIASGAPIVWPQPPERTRAEVESIARVDLWHQRAAQGDITRPDLPAWTSEVYGCYDELHDNPNDQDTWKKLDEIRASFDEASGIFYTTLEQTQLDSSATVVREVEESDLHRRNSKLQEIACALEALRAELAAGPSHLQLPERTPLPDDASYNQLIHEKSARLGFLYAVLAHKMAVISEMRDLLAGQDEYIDVVRSRSPQT